jgi:F-type H+-transporting ATPase subunit beta
VTDNGQITDGRIAAIRGGIVDVTFDGPVPKVHDLLYASGVALEVAALIGDGLVRAMAMAPVRGLGLGMAVRATGAPIMVPVGDAVLGRMLDVFGAPIDGLAPPEAVERRSIHRRQCPPLPERPSCDFGS